MPAFIINFQSPLELDDLWDRYERDGLTNIDHILGYERTLGEWTVHKDAQPGDRVFFMCAVSSKDHMGHICSQLRNAADAPKEIAAFAEKQRGLYRRYAGTIVAVGIVEGEPFQSNDSGYANPAWKSPWYAKIRDVQILEEPVAIDKFRDFIKISRTGSITKLDEQQESLLENLVSKARLGEPKQGFQPRFSKITKYADMFGDGEPISPSSIDSPAMNEIRDALIAIVGPSSDGYADALARTGIEPSAREICKLDIETASEDVALAILAFAFCGEKPSSDEFELLAKEGILEGCLYRLAEIDEDDLRERSLPKQVIDLAEQVLVLLEEVPEGEEGTVGQYAALARGNADSKDGRQGQALDVDELFDVDFYVWRHAADHGLILDNSECADMLLGLPFSIPFRVYHIADQ